jgi:hypothetical protein
VRPELACYDLDPPLSLKASRSTSLAQGQRGVRDLPLTLKDNKMHGDEFPRDSMITSQSYVHPPQRRLTPTLEVSPGPV